MRDAFMAADVDRSGGLEEDEFVRVLAPVFGSKQEAEVCTPQRARTHEQPRECHSAGK
jgi:hypothetical protein